MQAIVLGGTGQVGSKLVAALRRLPPALCSTITVLSRRPLLLPPLDDHGRGSNADHDDHDDNARVAVKIIDYDQLLAGGASSAFFDRTHNCAFMLMGVGEPRKVSRPELERIDADIPIAFAKMCHRDGGVQHISVLSALGANSHGQYSGWTGTAAGGGWYAHCKGKMEEGIQALPFASVTILRPAAIYPGNVNTPSLVGRLNEMLNPILPGPLQTVSSVQIAQCMVEQMQQQVAGDWRGVKVVAGGQAIKDALVVPQ